ASASVAAWAILPCSTSATASPMAWRGPSGIPCSSPAPTSPERTSSPPRTDRPSRRAAMTPPVLQLTHVTKRFAGHTAVSDLTLAVPQGGIFGLLGPNGAGKTTAIRMMLDIIEPDEGTIARFGGNQPARDLAHRIGFLPEERGLYK